VTSFRLFFAGAEQPTWRKLLLAEGAGAVAISFRNLLNRLPKTKPYGLAGRFSDDVKILIDSGAYGAKNLGDVEAEEYMRKYRKFVEEEEERIDFVTEFDHLSMGPDWIERWREDFWSLVDEAKFMPVWHTEFGPDVLEKMAERYTQIAVVGDVERTQSRLNGVVARHGVSLHGAAITKPDLLTQVRFRSASSTSWISPMKYGDTIVWDGHRLRRYPKAYKEQARKRHRMLFEKAGFNPDLIMNDDPKEVARLTIWSWLQQEAAVARRRGDRTSTAAQNGSASTEDVAATTLDEDEVEFEETEGEAPATTHLPMRNLNAMPVARTEDEIRHLPTMAFSKKRVLSPEGSGSEDVLVPSSTHRSLRRCDSCYVAGSCPAMTPGAECAFELPLNITTKEQLTGTLTTMLEIQAQRVAFARYAEEMEGGYPDPVLSSEMDRFFKMTIALKEIQDNRDFFRIQVEAKGNAGVLSAIFGDKTGDAAKQLPRPIPADQFDQVLEDIVDAQVISER
jgi:hypothetical protein